MKQTIKVLLNPKLTERKSILKPLMKSLVLLLFGFVSMQTTQAQCSGTTLATPANLRVSQIGTQSFFMRWDAVPNVSYYFVEVYEYDATAPNNFGLHQLTIPSGVEFASAGNLISNMQYTFTVTAIGDGVSYCNSAIAIYSGVITTLDALTDFHFPENLASVVDCANEAVLSWSSVQGASHYLVEMCSEYVRGFEGSAWERSRCGDVNITDEGNILKIGASGGGQSIVAGIISSEFYENLGGSIIKLQFETTNIGGNNNRFHIVANPHTINRQNCVVGDAGGAITAGTVIAAIQLSGINASWYTQNNPAIPMAGVTYSLVNLGAGTQGVYLYELTLILPNNAALNMQLPYGASPTDQPFATFGFDFQNAINVFFTGISIQTSSGAYSAWGANYQSDTGGGDDEILRGSNCVCYASRTITADPNDIWVTTLAEYGYTLDAVNANVGNGNGITWDGASITLDSTHLQPNAQYFWRVIALGELPPQPNEISDWSHVNSFSTPEEVTADMENALAAGGSAECDESLSNIISPEGWQWVDSGQTANNNPFNAKVVPIDPKYCNEPRIFKITTNCTTTSISELEPSNHKLISTDCYTVTGIKIDCNSAQGFFIKKETYDDGSVKVEKYVKK